MASKIFCLSALAISASDLVSDLLELVLVGVVGVVEEELFVSEPLDQLPKLLNIPLLLLLDVGEDPNAFPSPPNAVKLLTGADGVAPVVVAT